MAGYALAESLQLHWRSERMARLLYSPYSSPIYLKTACSLHSTMPINSTIPDAPERAARGYSRSSAAKAGIANQSRNKGKKDEWLDGWMNV